MFRKIKNFFGLNSSSDLSFRENLFPADGTTSDFAGEILTLPTASKIPPAFQAATPLIKSSKESTNYFKLGFLHREEIVSREHDEIIGYELMLNNSSELLACASPVLRQMHDELLLKSILALDVSKLVGDGLVFIHISPSMLEHAQVIQLPAHNIVLAFCPEVENADRLMTRCRELKSRGFRFSLDDFTYSPGLYPLLGLVDFLRFDITPNSLTDLGSRLEQIPRLSEKTLIAKNVHSHEMLEIAKLHSFRYCQGSLIDLSAPDTEPLVSRYRAKIILLMNMLQSRAETTEIENAMKQEGALAFRILRYINSPANGLQKEMHSISEVLSTLGHDVLYRWLSLLLFCEEISPCQHDRALLKNALLHGRLAELFGQRKLAADEKASLFATGMFSHLGLLLKMPLDKALSYFSLNTPMAEALLHGNGPYAPFLSLATACIENDQPAIEHRAKIASISIELVNTIYVKALVWVSEIEK